MSVKPYSFRTVASVASAAAGSLEAFTLLESMRQPLKVCGKGPAGRFEWADGNGARHSHTGGDHARAGAEMVRVARNNGAAAQAVPKIFEELAKQNIHVPIIGDFHYNGHLLLTKYPECAQALAKYRINPGNVSVGRKNDDNFRAMVEVAVKNDKPVRIGVNWGSLDQQLLTRMMDENSRSPEPKDAREV